MTPEHTRPLRLVRPITTDAHKIYTPNNPYQAVLCRTMPRQIALFMEPSVNHEPAYGYGGV